MFCLRVKRSLPNSAATWQPRGGNVGSQSLPSPSAWASQEYLPPRREGRPQSRPWRVCMALFVLGFVISCTLIDVSRDDTGLLLDEERLPKRVRMKKARCRNHETKYRRDVGRWGRVGTLRYDCRAVAKAPHSSMVRAGSAPRAFRSGPTLPLRRTTVSSQVKRRFSISCAIADTEPDGGQGVSSCATTSSADKNCAVKEKKKRSAQRA